MLCNFFTVPSVPPTAGPCYPSPEEMLLSLNGRNLLCKHPSYIALSQRTVKSRKVKIYPEFGKTVYVYKNLPEPGKGDFEENEFSPRRLSYWPPDLPQHRPRNRLKPWHRVQCHLDLPVVERVVKPEFTETPQYPPISDIQLEDIPSHRKQQRLEWYKKIRSLGSVEQKMFEQIDGHHGLSIVTLASWYRKSYDLNLYQNMTRTNLHHGLPDAYNETNVDADLKQRLANSLIKSSYLYKDGVQVRPGSMRRNRHEIYQSSLKEPLLSAESRVYDTLSACYRDASVTNAHLLDYKIDPSPWITSFWFVGGLEYPCFKPRWTHSWQESANQPILYEDSGVMNVRSSQPLPPVGQFAEGSEWTEQPTYRVSRENPGRVGYPSRWAFQSWAPGYWPDNENYDFPYLSVLPLSKILLRQSRNKGLQGRSIPDYDATVDGMAIMHSFAWLNSLAMYHGFSPYDELTYPLTTQTIITDGQVWYFYVYQMDTHAFHGDLLPFDGKIKYNNCWSSGPLELYESIQEDGTIVGFNDQVIDILAKFLTCKTTELSESVTLKPYLGQETRDEETIAKDRVTLRRRFASLKSAQERRNSSEARVDPAEYITGRNEYFNYVAHLRRHRKPLEYFKLDTNKFTL